MFGALTLGVALVAVSSRNERAMLHGNAPLPGVFATLGTELPGISGGFIRERAPALARVGRTAPALRGTNGAIGPVNRALMFASPETMLTPGQIDPIPVADYADYDAPRQDFGPFDSSPPPEVPDTSNIPTVRKLADSGSSGGGGGGSGGGSSSGGDGVTIIDPDNGGSSTGGSSGNPGGSSGGGSSGGEDPATPVPEPSTWAMMISGFLSIGALMRRRRVQTRRKALPKHA